MWLNAPAELQESNYSFRRYNTDYLRYPNKNLGFKTFQTDYKSVCECKKKIADIIIFGNKNNYVNLKVHLKIEFSMILLPILYFAF